MIDYSVKIAGSVNSDNILLLKIQDMFNSQRFNQNDHGTKMREFKNISSQTKESLVKQPFFFGKSKDCSTKIINRILLLFCIGIDLSYN